MRTVNVLHSSTGALERFIRKEKGSDRRISAAAFNAFPVIPNEKRHSIGYMVNNTEQHLSRVADENGVYLETGIRFQLRWEREDNRRLIFTSFKPTTVLGAIKDAHRRKTNHVLGKFKLLCGRGNGMWRDRGEDTDKTFFGFYGIHNLLPEGFPINVALMKAKTGKPIHEITPIEIVNCIWDRMDEDIRREISFHMLVNIVKRARQVSPLKIPTYKEFCQLIPHKVRRFNEAEFLLEKPERCPDLILGGCLDELITRVIVTENTPTDVVNACIAAKMDVLDYRDAEYTTID